MKFLLNGATAGSNFGDFIFAQMFQDHLSKKVGLENVYWYDSRTCYSEFYAKHLNNHKKYRLKDIDALIYISGGYFCGDDQNFLDYLFRYLNYFRVGLKCISKKIPYCIIGVEVGISKSKLMQRIQKKILTNANVVVVRNENSYAIAKSIGVKNLHCTVDSVFGMPPSLYEAKSVLNEIDSCNKKLLFFHINPSPERNITIEDKVLPAINEFLRKHSDYGIVVSTDQDNENQETAVNTIAKKIECDTIICNKYNDPIALCNVLNKCTLVVTTKLHVGIVGMRLGKSVVSFSGHTEKIQRLYEQMNEQGRTLPLKDLTFEKSVEMLEEYHDKPIILSDEIQALATQNFSILDSFLETIRGDDKT